MNDLENQDFHGDCRKSCLICLPWKSLKKGRYARSIYYLVYNVNASKKREINVNYYYYGIYQKRIRNDR